MKFKILNQFATKEEADKIFRKVDQLENTINRVMKENSELEKSVKQMGRILENYIPGRITTQSYESDIEIVGLSCRCKPRFTYIYKDGREHKISGLTLYKPEFEVLSTGAIRVIDKVERKCSEPITRVEYAIDLDKCAFITISEGCVF